ncbi:nli interacting factor family phosphatase [Cystoisospora suis]|uniref:protein-serine/threonine phosphatase n=1 Tax=Cystoisospora suis TaxID=483139 RepID=A0A2C6KIY1_9APIC|nr:nli interacting factor family phosphatase [Cystoisospora suis]
MSRCRETRPGMPCGSQIGVPHSTDWGTAVFQSTRDFPGPSIPLAIPAAHFFPALPTDSTSSAASVSAPGFARCSAGGPGDGPVPYRPPLLDTPKVGRGGQERTDEAWDTGRRRSRSREPSYGMDSGTAASARGFSVRGRHPGTAGAGDVRSRGQGSKHLRTSAATPAEPGIPHRHVASGRPYDSQQNQDYNSTAHQSGVKNGVLYRPSEAELQGFGFTHTRGLAAGDPGGGSDLLSKDVRGRTEQSPDCEGVSASMPVSQRPLLHRRTSLYADQIIDYHTGKLCPKRVKAAFMSVAQSVNLPHLVMPRWGHTAFAPSTTGMEVPAQFVCVTGGSGGGASLVNAGVWHHGSFVKPPVETATAWNHPGVPLGTELRPGDGESAMLDMSEVSSDESDEEMEDGEVEEARKRARPSRQRSGPGTQAPSSSWTTEPLSFQDGGAPDPDKGRVSLSVRPETAAASTSSSEKAPLWDPIVAKDLAAEAEHEKHSDVLQQQRSQTEGKVHPGPSSLLGPAPQRNAAALWPSASGVFGTQFGSSTGGSTSSVPVPASASPSAGEPGTETRSEGRTGRGESAVASNQAADTQLSSPSGAGEETERSLSRPRPTDPRLARQLKQRQQQSDSGQAASAEASSSAAPSGAAPLAAALSESSTNAAVPGVMRYVSTFDGSTIEMKNPPEPPAPGTLPAGLEQTCVARGKLPLLLDLDNTLLHAQAAAVTGCDVRLQDWLDSYGEPELYRFELPCNRKTYYMKLRPYLRTFLKQLEPFYEMSVYTNATQEYADIVVAILDEDRQLFRDR